VTGINIDRTPPVITGLRTPVANANGWNNVDVTVTFGCADMLSGVGVGPLTPQVVSAEGADQSRTGACIDRAGNSASATVGAISIDKSPPVASNVAVSPNPVPLNTAVTLSADLAALPPPGSKVVAAEYKMDNGSYMPMNGGFPGETLTVTATVGPFTAPGVHEYCVRGKDIADNIGADVCVLLAVYDPSAGFVTGGGWIVSPVGAYAQDPSLTGKANFGFVSKYQKGATVPVGETEFQFKVANLNFHSVTYDWLVIAGSKAQYKGSGNINGTGDYGFMLTATDGKVSGGGGVDRFRIKIWDKTTGKVIYDNQLGASDTSDPSTALAGGSIVVHK
jgi:hypothetical protein